jgi:hypothetical protein
MLEFTTIIVTILAITRTTMGPILGQPRDPTRDPKTYPKTDPKTTCNTWGGEE